ncbi:PREDICTED: UPF0472 protein C16orf72 homolog [Amphimedon queenslandica]|uniref:Uncharacterized protein n=1 Tax=Amphimedon queenslandica TaxID=400682 RepID=A0A1X7UKW3_AMPQE|nr:PREDICTED: UPF0472 protein C16orf72 homolog [Amphimedon queenslandica]|eukprot:XP_003387671.1 PREDICTED: UPF0472 protein C16orf72 homolog [Amphimedon queenslandica]
MAEGGREMLSPLEEQYIREQEAEVDADDLLATEKDLAAQRLWLSFQESATAVAHLFRDCQQRAGLSSWVPFHESASAVTQLYRDSADVCRQCIDCGVRYGYKKRSKDVLSWAKRKKRFIKREELIAFLMNKTEETSSDLSLMEETSESTSGGISGSVPSPTRRRLMCREELPPPLPLSDGSEQLPVSPFSKELPRKRLNSFSIDGSNLVGGVSPGGNEFGGPLTKRIKF